MRLAPIVLLAIACHSHSPPPAGSPDQTVAQAVALVCDARARAKADSGYGASPADVLAMHLTDGLGNSEVLMTVEGWKTDGIKLDELDALIKKAKLTTCPLRNEAR